MLRRALCSHRPRGGAATPSAAAAVAALGAHHAPTRSVTTRGQYNPIHDFTFDVVPENRASNVEEFATMITNPGPLRVGYSADYVDWLYKAYAAKVKHADARAKAESVFNGMLLSESAASLSGASSGASSQSEAARLPGAPPPGRFMRPAHSHRRRAGEAKRAAAQRTLDETAKQQGLLDLFERQPQFPVIHLNRASRFHIVELFKELVLDRALDPTEIWDKALLYRAILSERRASYPASFHYIFEAVSDTVLATAPSAASSPEAASAHDAVADRCPSQDDYRYFVYLVKRYYIDNAVEGHVVLRCHREPNAPDLLFSNPPPKDEQEVLRMLRSQEGGSANADSGASGAASTTSYSSSSAGGGAGAAGDVATSSTVAGASSSPSSRLTIRVPTAYPPIEALWRCEENLPLLKVLVFGELNLVVSENPFVKFPSAQGFLTRPSSSAEVSTATGAGGGRGSTGGGHRRGGRRDFDDVVSLASVIAERRGHLLPPIARNLAMSIDSRAHDLRRLQQRHQREDTIGFQKLLRGSAADEDPLRYSAYSDWSYFNPRAVRAETRDRLSRQALDALKLYDSASEDLYRVSYDVAEASTLVRPTEQNHTLPTYVPTVPHFVSRITQDPHIAFLLHVGLPDTAPEAILNSGTMTTTTTTPLPKRLQLEKLVLQLGRALYHTASTYHDEPMRRVNRQKVNVAAALLDRFVQSEWKQLLETAVPSVDGNCDDVASLARRMGAYAPFEARVLDESGFSTDARVADYARWMAPPTAATSAASSSRP